MEKRLIYLIMLLCVLYFFFENTRQIEKNICRDLLSDEEYLQHMIPHHQVAVDITKMYISKCSNPALQEIMRKLIWTQNYEINLMKNIKSNLPEKISEKNVMLKEYIYTIGDYTHPNVINLSNTYCDPHFFDPEKHMEHIHHLDNETFNDDFYIKHMIPHHQVAVDMSKVLLKHTENDFMIYLAYRIIRSQQQEIFILNELNKGYKYSSKNIIN